MKKLKRLVWYVAGNGSFLALFYFGKLQSEPEQWCWNLFQFWLWVTVALSLGMAVIIGTKVKEAGELRERIMGIPVPVFLDRAMDVGITAMLAATGCFVLASAWFLQMMLGAYCMGEAKEAAIKKQKEGK